MQSLSNKFFLKIKEGFINRSNLISSPLLGVINMWLIFLVAISVFINYKKKNNQQLSGFSVNVKSVEF